MRSKRLGEVAEESGADGFGGVAGEDFIEFGRPGIDGVEADEGENIEVILTGCNPVLGAEGVKLEGDEKVDVDGGALIAAGVDGVAADEEEIELGSGSAINAELEDVR